MTGWSWRPPGADALTDPQALLAGDRNGLLPALAMAGAQLRAVAEQLADAAFDRPRSLIVIEPGATADGALMVALLPRPRVPVVTSSDLPGWAGPLDLAVLLATAPDDEASVRAAAEAARRGVRLVVRAAERGPVADAAGAALIPPRIAVSELAGGPGRLGLLLGVALAADVATVSVAPAPGGEVAPPAADALHAAADALDAEALACGPAAEPFVNPAVALALRLVDGAALFVGDDPVGAALAARCARSVRLLGGHPAAAQHAAGLLPGGQLTAVLARADDPFADPDLDGTDRTRMVPVLISPLGADPDRPGGSGPTGRIAALARAMPRAVLLAPDDPAAAPFVGALTLALRVDFAAAYLGIAAGQVPPADGPDGLGPSGGARDVRPAATVEDVTRDDWDDRPWS